MLELAVKDLCFLGYGKKVHIKRPAYEQIRWTYCGGIWDNDEFEKGLLGLTENAKELCKNCVREYKRLKRDKV